MEYGQGKDIQANFRAQNNYGAGTNSLIRMVGHLGKGVGSALSGSLDAAAGAAMDLINEGSNFKNLLMNSKLNNPSAKNNTYNVGQQQPINQQSPIATQAQQANFQTTPPQQSQATQQNAASQAFAAGKYDTGAGYNPQSGTFRDGQGNVIADQQQSFEQMAAQQPIQNLNPNLTQNKQMPVASEGKKLNYFSYSK